MTIIVYSISNFYYVTSTGWITYSYTYTNSYAIRPVVYLAHNTVIVSGDGSSSDNAYEFALAD